MMLPCIGGLVEKKNYIYFTICTSRQTKASAENEGRKIWLICYFSTRSESRVGGHSTRWGQVDLHYFVSEAQTFTLTTIDDIVWDVISPSIHRSYFYIKFDSVRRGEITTLQTAEEKKVFMMYSWVESSRWLSTLSLLFYHVKMWWKRFWREFVSWEEFELIRILSPRGHERLKKVEKLKLSDQI